MTDMQFDGGMQPPLLAEDLGHLRVLRLNRPERKNALNGELIKAIHAGIQAAAADEDVWAIAVTGAGRAFCSGLDLAEEAGSLTSDRSGRSDAPEPSRPARARPDHLTVLMRVTCEKPIVAGVNGVAVGAGVSLALNADVRIAAPSARFHPGYTRIGLSPDLGLSWTLPATVGYERAMRFMLESRMVPAAEAREIGMVSEVVASDEDLETRLIEYGTMLAGVAPLAARRTKRLMTRISLPPDLAAHLDQEIELALVGFQSEDCREAIRAMTAGETPVFKGR